jgi:hypothetical protein
MKPKRHLDLYIPPLTDSIRYFITAWYRDYKIARKYGNDVETSINCSYDTAVKLYKNYRLPRESCPVSKELL